MKITILTMEPDLLKEECFTQVVKRAIQRELLELEIVDIREYATGSFRHIDDSPYGGGVGMILKYPVVFDALQDHRTQNSYSILLSPCGHVYHQKMVNQLLQKEHLILIAGHYEGVDARIEEDVDELVSLGDYILSSGEIGCLAIMDSLARKMEGIIRKESVVEESFEQDLLEYPQYTKPREYNGKTVPEVLLSGNHKEIEVWRQKQAQLRTKKYRPDLWEKLKDDAIHSKLKNKNGD